jgi:hypothetical protein
MPVEEIAECMRTSEPQCIHESDGLQRPAEPGGSWLPTNPSGGFFNDLNGAALGEIPGAAIFFLLFVNARLPAFQVQRLRVGLIAGIVVHRQSARGCGARQSVGDGLGREVVDDEIMLRA